MNPDQMGKIDLGNSLYHFADDGIVYCTGLTFIKFEILADSTPVAQ